MNVLRRLVTALVGISVTCVGAASAASAQVVPLQREVGPPTGAGTGAGGSGDPLLSASTVATIAVCLLAIAVTALVVTLFANRGGSRPVAQA